MAPEAMTILPLGFALGLVHALDADHVMAVSSMTVGRGAPRRPWLISILWSLGHSSVLLAVACVALPLGLVIPAEFSRVAEAFVGIGMIGLGVWVFVGMARQRGHIHFHIHEGLPSHAHWHAHSAANSHADRAQDADAHRRRRDPHAHVHAPIMMGALHGLAGSAPILALLPAVGQGAFLVAIAYIALFGVGVLLAMLLFGGLLGHVATQLFDRFGRRGQRALQTAIATGSMLVGVMILSQSV